MTVLMQLSFLALRVISTVMVAFHVCLGFRNQTNHSQSTCLSPRASNTAITDINPSTSMITDIPPENLFNIRHSVFNPEPTRPHYRCYCPPWLLSFTDKYTIWIRREGIFRALGRQPYNSGFSSCPPSRGCWFSSDCRDLGPATSDG